MLAGFIGGLFGSLGGAFLIGLTLVVNQLRLDRERRTAQDTALKGLAAELTAKVNSALIASELQDLSSIPQPRAEA
jgi:hypothetical protein